MYALQITEIQETLVPTVQPGNLIDVTLFTADNLDSIADKWIKELKITDNVESLRAKIKDKSFWYTNYHRGDIKYIVRVLDLQPENVYWLTADL